MRLLKWLREFNKELSNTIDLLHDFIVEFDEYEERKRIMEENFFKRATKS